MKALVPQNGFRYFWRMPDEEGDTIQPLPLLFHRTLWSFPL